MCLKAIMTNQILTLTRYSNYDLVYEEDVPDINTSKKKKQKDDSGEKV